MRRLQPTLWIRKLIVGSLVVWRERTSRLCVAWIVLWMCGSDFELLGRTDGGAVSYQSC